MDPMISYLDESDTNGHVLTLALDGNLPGFTLPFSHERNGAAQLNTRGVMH